MKNILTDSIAGLFHYIYINTIKKQDRFLKKM